MKLHPAEFLREVTDLIETLEFPDNGYSLVKIMDKLEHDLMLQALKQGEFTQSRAAKLLKTKANTFRVWLEKHDILKYTRKRYYARQIVWKE